MTDPRYPWALSVVERLPKDHPEGRPRQEWGPGPWQEEPDLLYWRHDNGLPLAIVRNTYTGSLCGYAGVLPGHPLYGTPAFQTAIEWALEAHGGITYAGDHSHLQEHGAWWFGFDCGHFDDLMPGLNACLQDLRSPRHWARYAAAGTPPPPDVPTCLLGGHYWTVEEVRADAEGLAVQLAAAGNAAVQAVLEDIAAGVRSTEDEAQ